MTPAWVDVQTMATHMEKCSNSHPSDGAVTANAANTTTVDALVAHNNRNIRHCSTREPPDQQRENKSHHQQEQTPGKDKEDATAREHHHNTGNLVELNHCCRNPRYLKLGVLRIALLAAPLGVSVGVGTRDRAVPSVLGGAVKNLGIRDGRDNEGVLAADEGSGADGTTYLTERSDSS